MSQQKHRSSLGGAHGFTDGMGPASSESMIGMYDALGTPWAQLLLDDFAPNGDPRDLDSWEDSSGGGRFFDWSNGESWTPSIDSSDSPVTGQRVADFYAVSQAVGYLGSLGDFQWETMAVGMAFRFDTAPSNEVIFGISNNFGRGVRLRVNSLTSLDFWADLRPNGALATNVTYPFPSPAGDLTLNQWHRIWFKKKSTGLDAWLDGIKMTMDTTVFVDDDTLGIDESWWLDHLADSTRCQAIGVGSWIEADATPAPALGMLGQIGEVVVWNGDLTDAQVLLGDNLMKRRLQL